MTTQQDLVARLRHALSDRDPREVAMFGGVSFMVEGRMVAAARGDGSLLLRVDPDTAARLRTRPGAHPARMGADRPMGEGWLSVDPAALAGPALDTWLEPALKFHAAQGAS